MCICFINTLNSIATPLLGLSNYWFTLILPSRGETHSFLGELLLHKQTDNKIDLYTEYKWANPNL